jgi:SAM-dependent methyltransferase
MDLASQDQHTADAFANSWNHLPVGSVYTREQFEDWLSPLTQPDVAGQRVLELGCGNASLLVHMAGGWKCGFAEGVDLGASVLSARENLKLAGIEADRWRITTGDLVTYRGEGEGSDVVYCIGVLHHLKEPAAGFASVLRNTRPGGRFHCWVYGHEGNAVVRIFVEPLRRLLCRFPWWFTKHVAATALAVPVYLYAKTLAALPRWDWLRGLPLYDYALWISRREFAFFRHVVFDQLVTPQTTYLRKSTLEDWIHAQAHDIETGSAYILQRNGNSWKFGGIKRRNSAATIP